MPADGLPLVPVHHMPTPARDLRAQAVHRLQVGLFGLAGMLLLVSLANVIMDRAQLGDASAGISAPGASASASAANDPLVDMGVAPELPVGGDSVAAKKSPAAAEPAN
ncbi:MAG: hypothetical protein B7Z36_05540 [Novosphingobium sp. 12-63-9]|nr:MAG: hypothetical protein B7Z36_05540 [Novosphingobium sp. 12-63-9]